MTKPAFTPTVPLRFGGTQPLKTSRCCRTRVPVRAVMSSEAVQAGETELPVSVNVFNDVDVSRSSIQSPEDIEEIIALAREFDIRDLRIADHGVEIEITRPGGRGFEDGKLAPAPVVEVAAGEIAENVVEESVVEEMMEEEEGEDDKTVEEKDPDTVYESDFVVTSDRVGFFFSGAKGKPPLVNVGDKVAFNQPVCIIQQLGQQYVYRSEASGTVLKMFVEDGDAVEYDQKVMVIRPD